LCQSRSARRLGVLQAPPSAATLCGREPAPEGLGLHVIGADALAVELDHRDQLSVPRLEDRIPVDRHLFELEPELGAQREQLRARALAEMTAVSFEQDDAGYGYNPRVMVASATRRTARPYAARRMLVFRSS
jgi:hypothetical protein